MSLPIVIDEWIIHDLGGDNGRERQYETLHFVIDLMRICNKFVIVKGSKVEKKFFELMDVTGQNTKRHETRMISQVIHTGLRLNTKKTVWLEPDSLPELDQIIASVVNQDDHYLVQAHLAYPDGFILTDDIKLQEALSRFDGITVKLRDDYLLNK